MTRKKAIALVSRASTNRDYTIASAAHQAPTAQPRERLVRVFYFTAVDVGRTDNGGAIGGRIHVRRLRDDALLQLSACAAVPSSSVAATTSFFDSLGVPVRVVALREAERGTLARRIARRVRNHVSLGLESWARANPACDAAVRAAVIAARPDVIIVDYLSSFLFCPSIFSLGVPVILLTVNPEAAMFRALPTHPIVSTLRGARVDYFERMVHRRCTGIIAIADNALPKDARARARSAVIVPWLDPQSDGWRSARSDVKRDARDGERTVFFVGNEAHAPNRVGINWLTTRFAPALARLDPSISIAIVGSSGPASGARGAQRDHANVQRLGAADRATVERLFREAALLLCPLDDALGSKIKIAEAVAFRTPFLTTRATLAAAPYLEGLPTIALDAPDDAAALVARLVRNGAALHELSRDIATRAERFRASQHGVWGRTLRQLLQRGAGTRSAR